MLEALDRLPVARSCIGLGIQDVFIVCCDGLKGVPESARATWPLADVQTCVDLVRSATRLTSKKHSAEVCLKLPEIHAAPPSRPPKTASPSSPRPAVTGFRPSLGCRTGTGCATAARERPCHVNTWRRRSCWSSTGRASGLITAAV